ncbi:MAG TPA: hypothetical protein VLL08_32880 [Kineosporiaceae bacterium]|nr:hypothetical protein [Kineosporiaceae bacterium]
MGRGKAVGVTAAAAVVLATLSSGGVAQASDRGLSQWKTAPKTARSLGTFGAAAVAADIPSVCTIDSYAPNKIVLGASSVTKTFSLKVSGCTLDTWFLALGPFLEENSDTAGVAGEGTFQKVDADGNPVFDGNGDPVLETLTPKISLSPRLLNNGWAGKLVDAASAGAWGVEDPDDTDEDSVTPAQATLPLTLQRRATFGTSFGAAPEPVKKGKKITLTGKLSRINWNGAKTLKYVGWAGKAQVQFKAAGASDYVTVKTVKASSKGKISTTVKATKTGTWRLFFAGLSTTAPATSGTDAVKVK